MICAGHDAMPRDGERDGQTDSMDDESEVIVLGGMSIESLASITAERSMGIMGGPRDAYSTLIDRLCCER